MLWKTGWYLRLLADFRALFALPLEWQCRSCLRSCLAEAVVREMLWANRK